MEANETRSKNHKIYKWPCPFLREEYSVFGSILTITNITIGISISIGIILPKGPVDGPKLNFWPSLKLIIILWQITDKLN